MERIPGQMYQMIDIVDKQTRSRMMAGIRSKNTKPEILIRKALHRLGYRFKLDSKIGKIKPDIVFRKHNVAVFAHGCYWHQHEGCKLAYSDKEYSNEWKKKFRDNKLRDQRTLKQLSDGGWRLAVIWECTTRDETELKTTINQLHAWIQCQDTQYFETDYKKT